MLRMGGGSLFIKQIPVTGGKEIHWLFPIKRHHFLCICFFQIIFFFDVLFGVLAIRKEFLKEFNIVSSHLLFDSISVISCNFASALAAMVSAFADSISAFVDSTSAFADSASVLAAAFAASRSALTALSCSRASCSSFRASAVCFLFLNVLSC